MEPDEQLSRLLREWQVGDAPRSLEERVLPPRRSWWRFLLTGYIRVPVPVGAAAVLALVVLAVFLMRGGEKAAVRTVSLRDFRPVEAPVLRVVQEGYANR